MGFKSRSYLPDHNQSWCLYHYNLAIKSYDSSIHNFKCQDNSGMLLPVFQAAPKNKWNGPATILWPWYWLAQHGSHVFGWLPSLSPFPPKQNSWILPPWILGPQYIPSLCLGIVCKSAYLTLQNSPWTWPFWQFRSLDDCVSVLRPKLCPGLVY